MARAWKGHMNRTSDGRTVKLIRDNMPNGRRNIGRPGKTEEIQTHRLQWKKEDVEYSVS